MVGGIANSVQQLVIRLRKQGNDVSVITAGLNKFGFDGQVYRAQPILKITRDWGDLLLCPSIYSALKKSILMSYTLTSLGNYSLKL
ncbi:hypothetical protein MCGE09_00076 [Thaumarchaeota archaeon SCGC AB-539-E09]|nr:hypothetical protein MCGE09_00076 [Thaumarchaeota archaeon SCGC AB-539-E09]